jgi:hypothetical protein
MDIVLNTRKLDENFPIVITCESRKSFRKVNRFLMEQKEPYCQIIKDHKVDFHITENQWKEIQELKIANIKILNESS